MLLRIHQADVGGPSLLRLRFNDGVREVVDASPLLEGPIFRPLLRPSFFRRVDLDVEAGTDVWPNGADLAPEALHALPRVALSRATRATRGTASRAGRRARRRA